MSNVVIMFQMTDLVVKLLWLLNGCQPVVMYNHKEYAYRQLNGRKRKNRKINLSIMAYSSNLLTDLIVSVSYISDMYMPLTK